MNDQERNKSFLGRGWSFPPRSVKRETGTSALEMSADEQDIRESLEILLSTRLGERIMLPGYGCDLRSMVFEGLTTSLITFLKDMIRMAIQRHESRIILKKTRITSERVLEGILLIELDYEIRTTNTRTNFVYPFYINEATDL